jgi:DNA ligase-1
MNKTFYGKDKGGKYKVWQIETAVSIGGKGIITIHHGQEGGKQTRKDEIIYEGKQGRTPEEQAVSEAEGRIKKQVDKGYRENKADLEELPLLAMLSGDYNKIGHRIDWENGVHVPDKFDGVRCLVKCAMGGGITLESRTGQPYDVPHIVAELEKIMQPGDVLDAELYVHGYVLQDITSAVKRTDTQKKIDQAQRKYEKAVGDEAIEEAYVELMEANLIHELRPKLQLHVFDMPSDKPWYERLIELEDYAAARFFDGFVKLTKNPLVFSEEHMKVVHKDAVRRGYEGVMLRNRMGMYESGKRSADLQKYKEFVDAEFEILDVEPAKDDGSVFRVRNDLNELTFTVAFGTMAFREQALKDKEYFISKFLNVKFQSRYKGTLLPQFPTGEYIREGKMVNGEFVPSE